MGVLFQQHTLQLVSNVKIDDFAILKFSTHLSSSYLTKSRKSLNASKFNPLTLILG
jgi:hypothetical protein